MRPCRVVVRYGPVHEIPDVVAVLFQLIEGRLDGLVDRLLDVPAHVLDLVDALDPPLVGVVRDEDGGHVEAGAIERRPLAQLLHDLHHDPLSVAFVAGLIGLREIKPHSLRMFLAQGLHDVQGAFAQRLADRIKEHEDEVYEVSQPQYGLVDVERVVHVAVDQSGGIDEGDQRELLLLRGGDLRGEVIHDAYKGFNEEEKDF